MKAYTNKDFLIVNGVSINEDISSVQTIDGYYEPHKTIVITATYQRKLYVIREHFSLSITDNLEFLNSCIDRMYRRIIFQIEDDGYRFEKDLKD